MSSPQRSSRYASRACRSPKRSGGTGLAAARPRRRPPLPPRPRSSAVSRRDACAPGRGRRAPGAGAPGRERHRPAVLAQDPGGELPEVGVVRDEDAVLDPSVAAEQAVDPPGRVAGDLDLGLALLLAHLPRRALAVRLGVEALRQPEVPLAPRGEADLASDPRHAERLDPVVVEVEADHVPLPAVEEQRIGIDRALSLLLAHDRPVLELQRPVLRDRALELREPARKLGRVARIVQLDGACRLRRRRVEPRTAEREVLEREAERFRVRELALEQVEAGLERRELLVGQLERRQEVALRAQAVQLLAGELVSLGIERNAQGDQLRAIGVEAARERLVRHLLVALDVLLHVPRRQRTPLGHEKRHERKLTDELVGVVRHRSAYSFRARPVAIPGNTGAEFVTTPERR